MSENNFQLDPSEEDGISLEASAWVAKHDEGLSAAEQDAFFEWLAADPRHREVYNERLAFWEQMNGLADWRPQHSVAPNPDLLAFRARPAARFTGFAWASAFVAVIAIAFLLFGQFKSLEEHTSRVIAFGGATSYENHVLDDGSIVELNEGAELSVQYSQDERLVFLHSGEAHFMVAKDVDRPFRVRAQSAVVEATGTAFNVRLEGNGIEVLVTEGKVVVDDLANEQLNSEPKKSALPLVAGQISVLRSYENSRGWEVDRISNDLVFERLSWKAEMLDFTDASLGDIVADFNRRNRVKIEIVDRALMERKLTASVRSNNIEGFIELLEIGLDINVERPSEYRILIE